MKKIYEYYLMSFTSIEVMMTQLQQTGQQGWRVINVFYNVTPGPIPNSITTNFSGVLLEREHVSDTETEIPNAFHGAFGAFSTEMSS